MGNGNGLTGIISIFGLILGIFLAVIGIGLVQDLVITMNTTGEACAANPVFIVNIFIPEICGEVTAGGQVTITGIGLVLLISMLMLIFIIIFSVFIILMLIGGNLSAILFFSIFFLSSFMLSYFLGIKIVVVFGLSILKFVKG